MDTSTRFNIHEVTKLDLKADTNTKWVNKNQRIIDKINLYFTKDIFHHLISKLGNNSESLMTISSQMKVTP